MSSKRKVFLKNRRAVIGLLIFLFVLILALLAPYITSYGPLDTNFYMIRQLPDSQHWFGTDQLGRDVFSRIIWGSRLTLVLSLSAVMISLVAGTLIGLIAGYFGGIIDYIAMRIIDLLMSFPAILLAIIFVSVLPRGAMTAMIAVGISQVPLFARLSRGELLSIKEREYVLAARASGASSKRVIIFYILPNMLSPLIVQASLNISIAIIITSALGFLGLGAQPPNPEWGSMLSQARRYLSVTPHLSIFPGLAITITAVAANLFGDGLREALDPRSDII